MAQDLDLPDELFGFGSWLLWVLATRATDVVDRAFAAGPARPSRHYGLVDGHPVPTPSLVAWLLAAAESGIAPEQLARRDVRLDERQKVLRTMVSRAIGGEPRLFKDTWLRELGSVCGLGDAELDLLAHSRDHEGYPVDPQALRTAIARTLRAQPAGAGNRPSASGAAVTRALPRDIASFTGRERELDTLMHAVEGETARSAGVVGIHAIGGMAGVGKTALAVHAAHRLADRFPDGQIFLLLHGHTPGHKPVDPGDALASLLLTAGVPAAQIPPGLDARMGLWRDRVAGRQLLLVLDDAADSEQVRPLLPGAGGSLVLITSRRHLTALEDTQAVSLDILPPGEAAQLFARLAARPGLDPANPAVTEITALCGYLPLAIGMVARQLHHHPAWTAASRAAELAAARDRLELMATENLSVAAAFNLSYANLTEDQQRLFRRLGLHPVTDIDAHTAAALDGTGVTAARRGLEALYDQYLLTEPAPGRYRLHDLIHEHARVLADRLDSDRDQDQARHRHAEHYAEFAERTREQLDGPAQLTALDRLEADNDNLRAALAWSLDTPAADPAGQGERAVIGLRLVQALTPFWDWHGHATEGRRWLQRAMDLASADGGGPLARLAHGLGILMDHQGEPEAARRLFERSLAIWRELGDREQQARELNSLGIVHRHLGDPDTARAMYEEAIAINRETGNKPWLASALANLGQLESGAGRLDRATQLLQEALALDSERGDPRSVAIDRHSLALVILRAGRPGEARDLLSGTFDYVARSGHTFMLVNALELVALIAADLGDPLRAARLAGAAEAIRQESGMPMPPHEVAILEEHLAPARAAVSEQEWNVELAAGRALTQQEAATFLFSSSMAHDTPALATSRANG